MLSNEEKAFLIEKGIYKDYCLYRKRQFELGLLSSDNYKDFMIYLRTQKQDYYKCNCMLDSRSKKRKRVKRKITNIVNDNKALFLTLTFNDKTLANTTQTTRRRYVARFLKKYCDTYAANIDFGGHKGREHYHAVVSTNNIDFKSWHKYGAINMRHVNCNCQQIDIVSQYITKLTAHALKSTTSNIRLIYSRKVL